MTAWLITRDYVEPERTEARFNCAGSYSDEEMKDLEARLRAGEGQPFLMGDDDWDYTKPALGENRDYLYYRGRVIFDDDKDEESGCDSDNMLIAWGAHHAGATKLIASPGDTSVPQKDWEYRGW